MFNKLIDRFAYILVGAIVVVPMALAMIAPSAPTTPGEVAARYQQHSRIVTYINKVQPSAPANRIALAIVRASNACNVDPYLVTALIHTESTFAVDATSETGARGLMQIVRSTSESLGLPYSMAYDIELNVEKGTCYLAQHLVTYKGRTDLALKRYNGNDDPNFVKKVFSRLRSLSDTYEVIITVKKGDTLAGLAETYLGDAGMYPLLAELNDIPNPDRIEIGQRIVVGSGTKGG